jgi:hypothetical protein
MKNITISLILLNIIVFHLEAQTINYSEKRILIQTQLSNLSAKCNLDSDFHFDLLNGRLYYPKGNAINHPYLFENAWKEGKIWFSGRLYDSVMLKYDICSDYLIYLSQKTSNTFPVYLNKEELTDFIISGHRFIYLHDFEKSEDVKMKPGYYEVIYNGRTRFYVRWEKTENLNRFTLETEYSQKARFYLLIKGNYINFNSQSSFINSFNDHSKIIGSFMKVNNLRFSAGNYESLIKVLEYYDNH